MRYSTYTSHSNLTNDPVKSEIIPHVTDEKFNSCGSNWDSLSTALFNI